ncbi:hypothetical protein TSH100_23645 [Azospirillum sp. TSH100]|uniref:hypothetical protein n=1 Tax=Azospirillum sp. TSH100 TaxID=652764 RepID=UPI000D61E4FD|nr:hypothetical protein [Azospirillum sp. TSH100]PWC82497.1 hypothetical protein TSH100_23645 [Azospirillum sp. TSH100]QCG89039.1 hypothetical protein E6C72_14550 [Azospirillum sp. TSH100]
MPLDRWKDVRASIVGLALRRQGYPVPTEEICRELTADGTLRGSYQKLLSRSIALAESDRTPVDIAPETAAPTQPGGTVPTDDEALAALYHSAMAVAFQARPGRDRQVADEGDSGGGTDPEAAHGILVAERPMGRGRLPGPRPSKRLIRSAGLILMVASAIIAAGILVWR